MTDYPVKDDFDENGMMTEFAFFYPDDEKTIADIIRRNWSLIGPAEGDTNPNIYYDVSKASTRDNTCGSILVYASSNQYRMNTIGYDAFERSRNLTIDIQNAQSRDRHYTWVRECLRILNHYRKAEQKILHGWDYLEVVSAQPRNNYNNYYQSTIELKLTRKNYHTHDDGTGVIE